MIKEENLKRHLAENLKKFRKKNNLTQAQLAQKLNYSDKSISKWERMDGVPDIIILSKLADLYGISVDVFIGNTDTIIFPKVKKKRQLITLISFTGVWALATIVYVALSLFTKGSFQNWLIFIYAIPLSLITTVVFTQLWGSNVQQFISVSLLLWSLILSIFLSFNLVKLWLLFVAGGALQLLLMIWYKLKK